ncbi:uncharacterized protein MEPE_05568 [Melanopsichium pennsylvanicum]|uniref:JmjC domain-containing protein n=2 Tax=Melanopsichium pennsylvanicum TaxID=63383 RepID=A0AAJ4XPQ2_9BASI|nr:clavaminate synthase-like protein [Melanopsichium pennsylvanicum 4]SNX86859.1 uncharacterized protein MEPE_05568 [Melanopsichium pennsylvanicum]
MVDSQWGQPDHLQTVRLVLDELQGLHQQPNEPDKDASCARSDASGLAARRQLRRIAVQLKRNANPPNAHCQPSSNLSALSTLTRLCDQKFVTYSYASIPKIWRAVYVDAQLLKACYALESRFDTDTDEAELLRICIRDIDLALIVAGAASMSKNGHCHNLISALQCRLLELDTERHHRLDRPFIDRGPPRKRVRVMLSEPSEPTFESFAQAELDIQEYSFDQAPSFMELAAPDSEVRSKPFIVRRYAQGAGWSAVQSGVGDACQGSWSSMGHLLRVAGPARVVPVEVGADYSREDWGQDVMLWTDFLQRCHWDQPVLPSEKSERGHDRSELRHPVLYMAQHDLSSQFPALERDYSLPDYVYISPPPPKDWPDYRAPVTPDGVSTNLWIGPAGTVSPPHYDPYYNCFVQAVGYKEVWVAPPHFCPSNTFIDSGEASTNHELNTSLSTEESSARLQDSITGNLMTNTARVDVFDPVELIPDRVRAAAARAILQRGDLLYMPPGWWHSLRSLTRSFSVSMWF